MVFTSVGVGADASRRAYHTRENPELPFTISTLAEICLFFRGQETWVAVVPVDSSDNSIKTDLTAVSSQSIDDGGQTQEITFQASTELHSPGLKRPISSSLGITPTIRCQGYQVHINSEDFMDISVATLLVKHERRIHLLSLLMSSQTL